MNAQETEKKTLTTEDYEQAAKFLPSNFYPLLDQANVIPNWLVIEKFWYITKVKSNSKYVIMYANTGKKK